jgi:hypothetical protein
MKSTFSVLIILVAVLDCLSQDTSNIKVDSIELVSIVNTTDLSIPDTILINQVPASNSASSI